MIFGAGDPWRAARASVLLGLVVAVPAVFDPGTADGFNVVKLTVLLSGAIALVALWALEWTWTGRTPRVRNGLQLAVVGPVAWTAAATGFASSTRVGLLGAYGAYDGLLATLALAIVLVAAADTFSASDVPTVLAVLVLGAGGLVLVYGIVQLHDRVADAVRWDPVDWPPSPYDQNLMIWSTLGNPNHLGGFLAIVVPAAVALLLVERRTGLRVVIGGVIALALVELLAAESRGAWLACLVGLAVLVPARVIASRGRPTRRRFAVALAPAVAVGAVGAWAALASPFGSVADSAGRDTIVLRLGLWQSAVDMGADRPLLGFGPDAYGLEFPRYQTADFVRRYGADKIALDPHNIFLDRLATTGAPGLAVLATFLGLVAVRGRQAFRTQRTPAGRLVVAGVVGAAAAFVVQAAFNVQQIALSSSFWLLCGLVAVLWLGPERPGPAGRRRLPRALAVPLTGLVAAAALLAAWQATRPYRADRSFLAASRAGGADRAHDLFEEAIRTNPWEPRYAAGAAGLALEDGRLREARAQYERALELNPRDAPVLAAYGRLLLRLDEAAAATRALRRAAEANPWHPDFARAYADALVARGELAGALAVLERALRRPGCDGELLVAAAAVNRRLGNVERAAELEERVRPVVRPAGSTRPGC